MSNSSDYPYEEVTLYDQGYSFEVPVADLKAILGTNFNGYSFIIRGNMPYEGDEE
jgi:hypothetical protein